ncbi:MAG: hypothetical protein EXR95_09565, partial [Gemmatimonadetes bacterium]|nr:hypothetical protein [Gemmatimonadota bacterium]
AYAAFAAMGTRAQPFPILKVENAQGEVLWEPQPERTQVLDSMVARMMVDMLQDAANRGTGAQLRVKGADGGNLPYEIPVGGKTGTTNDATDVWFNGFTPNLAASVWFGFDRPVTITPKATGGLVAAPTWGRFMRRVYYGDTTAVAAEAALGPDGKKPGAALPIPGPWPMHPGLTTRQVDSKSGRLWSEWCKGEEYTEHYVPGSEPTEVCDESGRGIFRLPRIGPTRGAGTSGQSQDVELRR